jgi:glutathione synthase/RimK-type ligase-like ATP-grasp enzyme
MILLWGMPGDPPMAQVRTALLRLGQPFAFCDEREVLRSDLEMRLDADINGIIRIQQRSIELASISAIYMRLYGVHQSPGFQATQNSATLSHAWSVVDAMLAWVELTDILVVNRPSTMESNNSKPFQLRLISKHGFEIPKTLITTDPQVVREFWTKHGDVVYKSISGVRSIVGRLTSAHIDRLPLIRWCPTQFQEYIPGKDYRVHVVGREVFASEITSAADDYRYAHRHGTTVNIRPYVMPFDVAERCRAITVALGLQVAGIDLRQRPDGRWYCFEVNPSPAFSYYQNATDQLIDVAIAQLLVSGTCSRSTT